MRLAHTRLLHEVGGVERVDDATTHVRLTVASTSSAASAMFCSPNGPNGATCRHTATAQLIELVTRAPMSTRSSCGSSNGRSTALATSTAQITPHSPQSILPAQPRAAAAQPSDAPPPSSPPPVSSTAKSVVMTTRLSFSKNIATNFRSTSRDAEGQGERHRTASHARARANIRRVANIARSRAFRVLAPRTRAPALPRRTRACDGETHCSSYGSHIMSIACGSMPCRARTRLVRALARAAQRVRDARVARDERRERLGARLAERVLALGRDERSIGVGGAAPSSRGALAPRRARRATAARAARARARRRRRRRGASRRARAARIALGGGTPPRRAGRRGRRPRRRLARAAARRARRVGAPRRRAPRARRGGRIVVVTRVIVVGVGVARATAQPAAQHEVHAPRAAPERARNGRAAAAAAPPCECRRRGPPSARTLRAGRPPRRGGGGALVVGGARVVEVGAGAGEAGRTARGGASPASPRQTQSARACGRLSRAFATRAPRDEQRRPRRVEHMLDDLPLLGARGRARVALERDERRAASHLREEGLSFIPDELPRGRGCRTTRAPCRAARASSTSRARARARKSRARARARRSRAAAPTVDGEVRVEGVGGRARVDDLACGEVAHRARTHSARARARRRKRAARLRASRRRRRTRRARVARAARAGAPLAAGARRASLRARPRARLSWTDFCAMKLRLAALADRRCAAVRRRRRRCRQSPRARPERPRGR